MAHARARVLRAISRQSGDGPETLNKAANLALNRLGVGVQPEQDTLNVADQPQPGDAEHSQAQKRHNIGCGHQRERNRGNGAHHKLRFRRVAARFWRTPGDL